MCRAYHDGEEGNLVQLCAHSEKLARTPAPVCVRVLSLAKMPVFLPYDHHLHCGNPGDLVKHAGLAACVHLLAAPGLPFCYGDAMAAFPEYRKPSPGWDKGVGAFLECARHGPQFAPYTGCLRPTGLPYPGSALLAAKVCQKEGALFHGRLWDLDERAVEAQRKHFEGGNVDVRKEDGLDGLVDSRSEIDFALIDPPDVSQVGRIGAVIAALADTGAHYLTWTYTDAHADPFHFGGLLREGSAVALRVFWQENQGCQLTFSPRLLETVEEMVKAVCAVMGWAAPVRG